NFFTDDKGWELGRGEETNSPKRGLLRFTQNIVDSGHAVGRRIDETTGKDVKTGFLGTDGKVHAKGRNLQKTIELEDGSTKNVYCRSWIKTDQYDSYQKAIRTSNHYLKIDCNISKTSLNTNSVLNNVGMPRIHPVLNTCMYRVGARKVSRVFSQNL
ncbi:MAG: hypothetical protein IIC74_08525, partial [Bacteroidetes bacterium]|nr:hypothetical protein [Bacteroidota bacterium]